VVPDGEALDGGDHPDRHAERQREGERAGGQHERRGQPLEDHLERRTLRADRHAEVAPRRVAEKAEVLREQRLVEPQRPAQIADLLRRRLLTEHERRGIPGRQVEQPEDHHGDEPEQQQRVERPPD
jgi:hypothetical protein